jgi:hypothetical protein
VLATLLGSVAGTAHAAPDAIARAQSWVDAGVGYSMSGSYTNHLGTYRTDCSGFVSMAWGLGTSHTTVTLPSVSFPIARDDLRPGDILLNPAPGASGHVVLFAGWADESRTRYYAYEQSPSSGANFTTIPYPYWSGYGSYAPYRSTGSPAASDPGKPPAGIPAPEARLPTQQPPEPPQDGDFVAYAGDAYRIAGGAPVHVSTWKNVGGRQPTRRLTTDEFADLRDTPADGTFLRAGDGEVYRIAGGAPIPVTGTWWKQLRPRPEPLRIDPAAVEDAGTGGPFDHLNATPVDGTWISTPDRSEVYRVVGGAPVHTPGDWWKSLRPRPEPIEVSGDAIDRAGEPGVWSHLAHKPADGSFVRTPPPPGGRGETYVMAGGAPIHVTDEWVKDQRPKPLVTTVSQESLDYAGGLGAWSHIRDFPADGTLLKSGAAVYIVEGGVPVLRSGIRGVEVDPAAIDNAGSPGPWSHLRSGEVDGP